MTAKLSLSIILVTLLLLLGSLTLASLPSRNDSIPGIHPVAGAVPNVLGLDCAYGSNAEGGAPFPSSVTASAPYSAPDFDGTLDSSCLATYLADTGALEPLASDNPAVVAPGSGGGLTIDVVASLNATTTINGFDISVQYDPHYLNGVIIDQSGLIWGGNGLPAGAFVLTLAKTLDNVNGVARVAQVLVGAPQQSGTSELFRVRFDLVGANPSTGVHIVSDTLTNPGNVQHTTNAATSIDTTMIYDFVAGVTLGAVASWTSSPSPAVPLSPLTFTATATCSGCTTPLSFSWDFSALDSTPRPLPAQATTNPATITPPAPVVNRVVLTITDAATHSIEITRLLPLVVRESPSLTTLAAGTASGAWSGQWLGGVTTATAGYSGGWTFCPGSALVKTVCSAPTVTVSQSGAGVTQTSSAGAENYLFAGLFNATLRISDAPELQVGTSPSGNVVIVNFFNNVTGATAAYTVAVTGNATSISPNQAINFTATPTYATTYPSNFRSNSFRYLWSFGDGSPTASTTNSPGLTSSFIVHTYTASGPHTVTVTATETANAAVTHIVEVGRLLISVSGGITPPTVLISCPTSGTVGVMVPCTATGSGGTTPYTFAWTATGGSPASGTGASFATTYTVKGSDTISVTLTDSESPAKTATASTTVTIAPVTLAVTISGPTTGSINSPLVFTANPSGGTTPYMFAWTATGGSPASGTGSSCTTMFATSGPQSVSVTVTDANAKTATASATVTISPTALTVTITCPTGGTVGSPVNCTATSSGGTQPVAFSWTAIGGSPSSGTGASSLGCGEATPSTLACVRDRSSASAGRCRARRHGAPRRA